VCACVWVTVPEQMKSMPRAQLYYHTTIATDIYKASWRSLFMRAILDDTLRSIVRSPISTTRPPRISGLT